MAWQTPQRACQAKPSDLRVPGGQLMLLQHSFGGSRDHVAKLACIRQKGELAAAAVFMFGPRWGHYHLSARRPDAGNHLTNCLLQDALERAAELGLLGMHLGGGRSGDPRDNLLMFKKSIGGQLLDYNVALVIANFEVYRRLCLDWEKETGWQPQWLLGYRQPRP